MSAQWRCLMTFIALVLGARALAQPRSDDRALGKYLFSECITCHQTNGKQTGAIPAISRLSKDQFIARMMSFKRRERDNPVMQTIAARLSMDELAALAAYICSLQPKP
jgi:cytochrome c553